MRGRPLGPRRQVPDPEEVPAAANHLGRGAEDALLQGEDEEPAEGDLPPGSLSQSVEEARPGTGHWTDADAGRKLVQEPKTEGQSGRRQEQVKRLR